MYFYNLIFQIQSHTMTYKITNFQINHQNYKLIVAETKRQRYQGLMNTRELIDAAGMIFLFPDTDFRIFSNRNTLMDLEIYWLQDERIVGKDFLPSFEISGETVKVYSPEKVNVVIELPTKN